MSKSRLKKVAEGEPSIPMGIIFRDFDKKIVNKDKIEKTTYGPSNFVPWDFEKSIDNSEWGLQTSFTKNI